MIRTNKGNIFLIRVLFIALALALVLPVGYIPQSAVASEPPASDPTIQEIISKQHGWFLCNITFQSIR